jgi:FkbM family methyltransferase
MLSVPNLNLKKFYFNIYKNLGFLETFRFLTYCLNFLLYKKLNINSNKIENFKYNNLEVFTSYIDGNISTFLEIFEEQEYEYILNLTEKKKIKSFNLIDCGANVGYCYSYFKNLNLINKYIGVEPIEYNFKILFLNTFSKKTTLFNKALWINNKGVTFTNTTLSNSNSISKEGTLKVETVTLEELFNILKEDSEDIFLKIDIEGAEYEILEQNLKLIENKVKYFAIEFHNTDKNDYKKYTNPLEKKFRTIEQYKEKYNCLVLFGIHKNL